MKVTTEKTPSTVFTNYTVIMTLLLLSLVTGLFVTWCLKRSSWNRTKFDLILWKRRNVGISGVANRVEKEVVKVGWTVGDVECWNSSLLLSYGDETEHERLLLAVTPHRTKSDLGKLLHYPAPSHNWCSKPYAVIRINSL